MILDGNQCRELRDAILDAFTESDLESLVLLEFRVLLETITTAENLSKKVLDLIVHCEQQGSNYLERLIKSAYDEKPGNENLKRFHDKYFQISVTTPDEDESSTHEAAASEAKAYLFPEVGDFDLYDLISLQIKPVLRTNAGLIGIAIPCESEKFRIKFCERLKKWLDSVNPKERRKVRIVDVQALDPKISSAEEVAKAIYTKCKDTLSKKRDVIYSVKVSAKLEDSSYANKFWQLLESEFHEFSFKSRLIIFMNGTDATIFPDRVHKFPAPRFDVEHVWNWIGPIAKNSAWGASFWQEDWMNCMNKKCSSPERHILIIERVYNFLDTTVRLLGNNLSDKEDFIDKLRFEIYYD